MESKIILFDIDGTLIDLRHNYSKLSDYTKEVFLKLKEQGHTLWIASGRPYNYIIQNLKEFPFDGMILSDGTHIIYEGKEVAYHPIKAEDLHKLLSNAKKQPTQLYTRDNAYCLNTKNHKLLDIVKMFLMDMDSCVFDKSLDEVDDIVIKMYIQYDNKELYDNFTYDDEVFAYVGRDELLLKEFYPKAYTKATALEEVLELLHKNKEDTIFFGDGMNDIELLQFAHLGVAMDNASDEVKKYADDVCGKACEDGAARYLEELLLKR